MTKRSALDEVLDAWRIRGPAPSIHESAKRRLHRDWPTLFVALDNLDRTSTHSPTPGRNAGGGYVLTDEEAAEVIAASYPPVLDTETTFGPPDNESVWVHEMVWEPSEAEADAEYTTLQIQGRDDV